MRSSLARGTQADPANDVLTVTGARTRVSDETDALLVQFEVSDRRPESEGPIMMPWLSIPRGLLPDLIGLLAREAEGFDT